MQPLLSIKVVLSDLKSPFIQQKFYQNQLINECARKNLAKQVFCDLVLTVINSLIRLDF